MSMNTPNSYYPGDLVKLAVTIAVDGVDTDPSTISLVVIDPSGNQTSYTPSHDSTGNYHYAFDTTGLASGIWYYVYSGTGTAQGAKPQAFYLQHAVP